MKISFVELLFFCTLLAIIIVIFVFFFVCFLTPQQIEKDLLLRTTNRSSNASADSIKGQSSSPSPRIKPWLKPYGLALARARVLIIVNPSPFF